MELKVGDKVVHREYVVGLSDGHWAYSYQINPLWKRIELNE